MDKLNPSLTFYLSTKTYLEAAKNSTKILRPRSRWKSLSAARQNTWHKGGKPKKGARKHKERASSVYRSWPFVSFHFQSVCSRAGEAVCVARWNISGSRCRKTILAGVSRASKLSPRKFTLKLSSEKASLDLPARE